MTPTVSQFLWPHHLHLLRIRYHPHTYSPKLDSPLVGILVDDSMRDVSSRSLPGMASNGGPGSNCLLRESLRNCADPSNTIRHFVLDLSSLRTGFYTSSVPFELIDPKPVYNCSAIPILYLTREAVL
ncbi:conserved hypothetical protein, partial [Trichinella spiralis]|uniref:hypothetical protein n=1 Tax=Trichinella spiralis TaxID=6334 RepID=UPI0001EFE65D